MATAMVLNDILRTTMWCTDNAQAAATTWHWQVTAVGAPPATDQDLGDTLDSSIAAAMKTILSNNASYRGIVTQKIWPVPVAVDVISVANAGSGTSGATALPKQVSGITSWYTALGGRSQRGRSYWPFPATSSDTGDGIPTGGYVTAIAAIASVIRPLTAIAVGGRTATIQFGIYHRASHTLTPITVAQSRTRWATQRRRGDYGRSNSAPI